MTHGQRYLLIYLAFFISSIACLQARCVGCHQEQAADWVKAHVMADRIPKCPACTRVVKPDIVFFGEVRQETGETGMETAERLDTDVGAGVRGSQHGLDGWQPLTLANATC